MSADAGPGCSARSNDVMNCGGCGIVCAVTDGEPACSNGLCVVGSCHDGFADCDGNPRDCEKRTNTLTDCGGCAIACRDLPHAVASCAASRCEVARCEAGYDDCDKRPENGCEAVLGSLNDCGGCSVACDKTSCAGGVCTSLNCPAGFGDCDGDQVSCEVNLQTDANNCGRCAAKCEFDASVTPHAAIGCTSLGCAAICDSGYLDCDGDYRNGCEPFVDTDKDGFADCKESCDTDPNKQSPGVCGCGVADTDSDGDDVADCKDGCPSDPTQSSACLTFAPSNFDPKPINWSAQPSTTLNCGTTTLNTTDPDGNGPLVATITNWCGTAPVPVAQNQAGGAQVVIVPLRGLTLSAGNSLRLLGSRPLILAVDGAVTINGTLDASASGTTAGAGGNSACGSSQGGNGTGSTARFEGASGGGGGGFGSPGGRGGTADTDGNNKAGGVAGVTRGASSLVPLLGGCAGGQAGGCSTAGAAGGGAVQISASGLLDVNGTVRANGGAGATPCGSNDEGGGTGGGSGGGILLEASSVDTSGAMLQANGGAGGANGSYAGYYSCGDSSGGAGASSSSSAGSPGVSCQGGGSGGGGGYGRIRIATR